MDEQKPTGEQDNSTANTTTPTAPIINDIMPPPTAQNDGQDVVPTEERITVTVTSSTDETATDGGDAPVEATAGDTPVEVSSQPLVEETPISSSVIENEQDTQPTDEVVAAPSEETAEDSTDEVAGMAFEAAPIATTAEQPTAVQQQEAPAATPEAQPTNDVPTAITMGGADQAAPAAMATIGVASSQMNKPPHRNNKKLAAIMTIVVAVILAVVAVFVYVSANKNTVEEDLGTSTEDTAEVAQEEVTPATAADVDQTNASVDEALKSVDEATDFAEGDLSDTTLGL